MRKSTRWVCYLAAAAAMPLTAPPLTAQSGRQFAFGGIAAYAERQSAGSLTERLTGVTRGFEGRAMLGRFLVHVRYLEGNLSTVGESAGRDLVEGEAFLGLRPISWVTLKAGPHVRSYLTGDVVERWVFWEGRLRVELELFLPATRSFALHSYLEGWRVLSADVNIPESVDDANGVETGMMIRLTQLPIWARIAYRVDRANLSKGARRETVQELIFALGLGG